MKQIQNFSCVVTGDDKWDPEAHIKGDDDFQKLSKVLRQENTV